MSWTDEDMAEAEQIFLNDTVVSEMKKLCANGEENTKRIEAAVSSVKDLPRMVKVAMSQHKNGDALSAVHSGVGKVLQELEDVQNELGKVPAYLTALKDSLRPPKKPKRLIIKRDANNFITEIMPEY